MALAKVQTYLCLRTVTVYKCLNSISLTFLNVKNQSDTAIILKPISIAL